MERLRSTTDRRNYELRLTDAGKRVLGDLRGIAEQHEAELLAPLTTEQIAQLDGLLAQLATGHGLDRDLHREVGRDVPRHAGKA